MSGVAKENLEENSDKCINDLDINVPGSDLSNQSTNTEEIPSPSKEDNLIGVCRSVCRSACSNSGSDSLVVAAKSISPKQAHPSEDAGDENDEDDDQKRKEKGEKSSDIDLDTTRPRGSDTIHKVERHRKFTVVAQQDKRFAITVPSLNQEEDSIICRNDVLSDLTHFKAGSEFHFKGRICFAKGSFGEVWDIDIDESVKDKFPSNCTRFVLKKTSNFTEDEKYLYDEKITNHANIVETFLVVCKKEGNFTHRIVMERCGDKSVEDYVYGEFGLCQMEMDKATFYWLQIVNAVVHLHSKNVIHMDITLCNILLRDRTCVKLADFGHAERLYDGCSVRDFSGIGTPYTAQEIMDEKVYGQPADIYSLGVSFLQMLRYAPRPLDVYKLKDRDKDLGALIERCLDECPSERPTAREIQKKLEIWERSAVTKDEHS